MNFIKKFFFNKIARDIKSIKIQGATNVAKAALKAYYMFPNNITKRVLMNLRPTEPMLTHVLNLADKKTEGEILNHFSEAQDKINEEVFKLIKNNSKIFTHCHSTNVIKALIYAKRNGKNFEVYNNETRTLFQGRRTAEELTKAGIKVTNFVDSAAEIAIAKQGKNDKEYVNMVFLGADALLENAIINKIGSGMFSRIAYDNKVPVYIIADSWKFSSRDVKLEQRDFSEVWGTKKVHIRNPAFEAINAKFITEIISELGRMKYDNFLEKVYERED